MSRLLLFWRDTQYVTKRCHIPTWRGNTLSTHREPQERLSWKKTESEHVRSPNSASAQHYYISTRPLSRSDCGLKAPLVPLVHQTPHTTLPGWWVNFHYFGETHMYSTLQSSVTYRHYARIRFRMHSAQWTTRVLLLKATVQTRNTMETATDTIQQLLLVLLELQ